MRREWKTFHRSHEVFSKSLDHDFREYRALVEWVNGYPKDEIARRLRYLRDRKASLVYRSGLYSGGMERYGLLPLIVVLYIQFKDWSFGDWEALGKIHLLGGLLLWMLLVAYLGAWWLVALKTRLDTYEALLAESLTSRDEILSQASPPPSLPLQAGGGAKSVTST